jgi:hypothetical protein
MEIRVISVDWIRPTRELVNLCQLDYASDEFCLGYGFI